jgi:hypothetical protein
MRQSALSSTHVDAAKWRMCLRLRVTRSATAARRYPHYFKIGSEIFDGYLAS